ncbi:hypothetical protein CPLU01_14642 [Colletotrichum plurivorum]|uniref:Uncharacterized protein n=1 Tax=Colletotrichum plurivorum TaxID=2175906 RepID=A0A8H6JHX6_9PEZI|nr:hypothetical protein CPLU01_14642 [Colletotrichum plurivorum]
MEERDGQERRRDLHWAGYLTANLEHGGSDGALLGPRGAVDSWVPSGLGPASSLLETEPSLPWSSTRGDAMGRVWTFAVVRRRRLDRQRSSGSPAGRHCSPSGSVEAESTQGHWEGTGVMMQIDEGPMGAETRVPERGSANSSRLRQDNRDVPAKPRTPNYPSFDDRSSRGSNGSGKGSRFTVTFPVPAEEPGRRGSRVVVTVVQVTSHQSPFEDMVGLGIQHQHTRSLWFTPYLDMAGACACFAAPHRTAPRRTMFACRLEPGRQMVGRDSPSGHLAHPWRSGEHAASAREGRM